MAAEQKKVKKSRKDKNANLDDFDMEKELKDLEEAVHVLEKKPEEKPKEKKGRAAKKIDLEDFDAEKELKELEEPVVEKVEKQPDEKPKGKKGKGKAALEDFDMEKELKALEETPVEAAPAKKNAGKAKGKKTEKGKDEDELDQEQLAPTAEAPPKKAAADSKTTAKKPAEKGADTSKAAKATAAAPAENESTEDATSAKKGDTAGKKPVSKNVAAIKEQQRRIAEARERAEREEDDRIRREEEAEQKRLDEIQKEKDRKDKKKLKDKERNERLKAEGKLLTTKQKQDKARALAMLESLKAQGVQLPGAGEKQPGRPGLRSGARKKTEAQPGEETAACAIETPVDVVEAEKSDSASESTPEDWDQVSEAEIEVEVVEDTAKTRPLSAATPVVELPAAKEASTQQELGHLRSAVVCVLGHVDTGKTKILDKIRRTNVQDMEAGGITQQIGATMIPAEAMQIQCAMVRDFTTKSLQLPGLLIIDTPGHESFSNLRSRGSSLCDIAILVVDIMHGLEPQTIESLNMLKKRRTPFVVALNKIDRLFNWKSIPKVDIRDALAAQPGNVVQEFKERTKAIIVEFAEQGTNAALFYENPDETFSEESFVSMVPTSAHTGDGMGNLMAYLADVSQRMLTKRLTFSSDLSCTVLEVKELTGLGTTIDVILTNGTLKEGDTIVVAGFEGPVVTQVRGLLMPQPLREMRVKNPYENYKMVNGAQGIKILAKNLESCLAGLPLLVANTPDEQERCKNEIEHQLEAALKSMNYQREDRGVYVQASTLGSLEALLEFLRTSKIPYSGINIGPVHKKDVRNASTMLEHDSQYAVILAFDVKVEREAQQLADEQGVRIFSADIIYHLFDRFTTYQEELKAKKREENKHLAIFPCKLKILPQFIFNTRDPIIVGVTVEAGILKIGTPLIVPSKEMVEIGVVSSMELNHKPLELAKKGQEICIKIDADPGSAPKLLGRHFEVEDVMVSKISRASIDVCKDYFRDDLTKADWQLMVELKKVLDIF